MLDLVFLAFIGYVLVLGLRRPFLWVLLYVYIDILAPQRIGYSAIASLPVSLIAFAAAFGGFVATGINAHLDNRADAAPFFDASRASLSYARALLTPPDGSVLGKIIVLVLLILFIQRRPRGMFPLKGRAAEA